MTGGLAVVKVGGNQVDDAVWVARLAVAVAGRKGPTVLVHGGGKEVTALQAALGIPTEWRDGLRVTSPEAVRAVSMVLSGLVNKRLVAALIGAGSDALGVSGEDAGLLRARVARGGTMGRIGEVETVRAELLREWTARGLVPILSPVSRGPDGGPLNVNADDAAAAVAAALGADELLFVSDVPGVMADGALLRTVGADEVERMVEDGTASGGMAPKLRAAARAAAVVARVRIGGLDTLADAAAGTTVEGSHGETHR